RPLTEDSWRIEIDVTVGLVVVGHFPSPSAPAPAALSGAGRSRGFIPAIHTSRRLNCSGYHSRKIERSATAGRHFSAVTKTKLFDNFSSATRIANRGEASMLREQSIVYDPEELSLLGRILDQVLESLPVAMRTPNNRTEIAKSLLACGATGERDPNKLKRAATIDLKVSTAA